MALNPSRRVAEIVVAAALVAVAAAVWIGAGAYPPESSAYPRALAALLAAGGALVILREARRAPAAGLLFDHAGRFALGAVALLLYVLAIGRIGYLLPSLALTVGLAWLLGYRRAGVLVAAALSAIAFIVLVFRVVLGRPMPPDLLDPLLRSLT